jgi:feruloyl esterase
MGMLPLQQVWEGEMSRLAAAVLAGLAFCAGAAHAESAPAAGAPIKPVRSCSGFAGYTLASVGLQITKATPVPAAAPGTVRPSSFGPPIAVAVPSYCLLEGTFERRTGSDGKPYAIAIALALPDAWNGRFLFQGGGGLNGSVNPPYGAGAAGDAPALARGFAVISTDSGHKGEVFDASFMKEQQAQLNFAQASVGKVTAVGKRLVAAYYGRPPHHSYFDGCSTGGREAMLSAERYPNEFDGIVAGDPAMRTGHSNMGLAWAAATFDAAAPKDASGKPQPGLLFPTADKKLLIGALLDACDGLDGSKDGLIFDFGACRFDPAVLTCKGAKTDACLSTAQVDAVKTAFAGPRTKGGTQVYPPFPLDTGVGSDGPGIPGFLPSTAPGLFNLPKSSLEGGMDVALAKVAADGGQSLIDTWNWTNLSGFFGHGGKILFYHGLSDPWFSPLDTLGYYQRLEADNGGPAAVQASSRIFMVPGMGHCQGGAATLDTFDLLTAVVDWVEQGKAPDSVVATGQSLPGQSRPLCAWPAHAQYKGSGDPKLAASYECRA